MVRLLAKTAAWAALPEPVEIGQCRIEEVAADGITWVAPHEGKTIAGSKALGLRFPKPGEVTTYQERRALWFGPGQALIFDAVDAFEAVEDAAVADQSSAWCIIRLSGECARDVLARVTPLDLRDAAFPENRTARTLVGHMTASLSRVGKNSWEIMVFRSMAVTLVHDLTRAMKGVEARARL